MDACLTLPQRCGNAPQVALLKKAKLDDRLSEFFPPSQRNLDQLTAHFKVLDHPLAHTHALSRPAQQPWLSSTAHSSVRAA